MQHSRSDLVLISYAGPVLVPQVAATHCLILQHMLQHTATQCNIFASTSRARCVLAGKVYTTNYNTMQHICNTLQHTLQHIKFYFARSLPAGSADLHMYMSLCVLARVNIPTHVCVYGCVRGGECVSVVREWEIGKEVVCVCVCMCVYVFVCVMYCFT